LAGSLVCDLTSPRLEWPQVGLSANRPVTPYFTSGPYRIGYSQWY